MGYQEYIYKVEDINQALKKKDRIVKETYRTYASIELVQLYQPVGNLSEGYYLWISGERYSGKVVLSNLIKHLKTDNYGCVEEMVYDNFSKTYEETDICQRLRLLFKNKISNDGIVTLWKEDYWKEDHKVEWKLP
ncbi:MAG: hypothetical protein ACLTDM_19535 [Clostridium butyricum]